MIDKDLLELLACPACKTPVRTEGDHLRCDQCGRAYPVENDIPVMLIDKAVPDTPKP